MNAIFYLPRTNSSVYWKAVSLQGEGCWFREVLGGGNPFWHFSTHNFNGCPCNVYKLSVCHCCSMRSGNQNVFIKRKLTLLSSKYWICEKIYNSMSGQQNLAYSFSTISVLLRFSFQSNDNKIMISRFFKIYLDYNKNAFHQTLIL